WETYIPTKYAPGQIVKGKVTKITNFGVFVGLEDGLEGLLHISELADHKVDNPEQVVKVGEEIEVKILRVDKEERKIGLSRKRLEWAEEEQEAQQAAPEAKEEKKEKEKEKELKGGLGASISRLIQPFIGGQTQQTQQEAEAKEESSTDAQESDEGSTA
ncbi:MAG TPA: S1 RNA-binding domain-containing protein, partial [Thermogutta sp.]|nr:S1 RNA-binding domain-containing protein [Thermogutta sp.]